MARTDEAVGVGGTGASEWSEPTKSSSMELKNFIPEAAIDKYEQERDEEDAAEPDLTPSGEVRMPDILGLEDPESYVVDDPDELAQASRSMANVAPQKKRGRRKGQKADPKTVAIRRAAFSAPISTDDINKLAAQYGGVESEEEVPTGGPTPAELAAIEREEGGGYSSRPTRGSAGAASDVQAVLAKQARARKRDPNPKSFKPSPSGHRNPATGYRPDPNAEKHRWPEFSSVTGHWFPWDPKKAGFIPDDTGVALDDSERDLLSRYYELEDEKGKSRSLRDFTKASSEPVGEDEQEHPAGAYVYDDPAQFQQMQPTMASLLSDKGVDPSSGAFMKLSRKFKAPTAPPVLDPESSEFSAEKYFEYVYKMMSHQAAQLIPWGQKREWTFFFPETVEPGEINGAWVFNPGLHDWEQITPELQANARESNEERRAEAEAKRPQPKQNWWEREVDPQGDWVDVGSLDPSQAEDAGIEEPVGGVSMDSDEYTPPEDEERWEPHPDYPGRYWDPSTGDLYGYRPGASRWQQRQMSRGMKVSDLPTHGVYDEGYQMKIGEFFGLIKEAHGERAERQGHGLTNREMNKQKKEYGNGPGPADEPHPDEFDDFDEDDGFGDEIEGGDMFQNRDTGQQAFISSDDPTSSQGNPEHTDIPGGSVDAPPGVFQGSEGEGFGAMDEPVGDEEGEPMAGGPEDPEVAGLLPDPDFGSEQSGDEPPEMKSSSQRVDLPDYEYQKYGGQRNKQPSPEAKARRRGGW